jgi:hypothetical protein
MQQKQLEESEPEEQEIQLPYIQTRASASEPHEMPIVIEEEDEDDSAKELQPQTQSARRTPGVVTRVVGDLMVFAEVEDNGPFGLVFMPDVIADYQGERLQDLGIVVGATISVIEWDRSTRLVSSVVVTEFRAPYRTA